ncbi:hypothetical protein CBOM_00363 [Ceraceosorus bombacis]|uniref:Uncharacterized protein n=1 Tax=Ceraceosorus bombacis TaxID=401625 RepID=A0A0P1BAX9_9BASI|nr:hypothetical protein CBOM_00363 [Ceraceosorus bombacis]
MLLDAVWLCTFLLMGAGVSAFKLFPSKRLVEGGEAVSKYQARAHISDEDVLESRNAVYALKRRGLGSLICCKAMPEVDEAAHTRKWAEIEHLHENPPHVSLAMTSKSSTFRPIPKEWEGVQYVNHPYVIPTKATSLKVDPSQIGAHVTGSLGPTDVRLESGDHDWHVKQNFAEDIYGNLQLTSHEITKIPHTSTHLPMDKLPPGPDGGEMRPPKQIRRYMTERPELVRDKEPAAHSTYAGDKTWEWNKEPNELKKRPSQDLHLKFHKYAPIHFREVRQYHTEVAGQPTFVVTKEARHPPLPEQYAELPNASAKHEQETAPNAGASIADVPSEQSKLVPYKKKRLPGFF